jgi:hypothetical protein
MGSCAETDCSMMISNRFEQFADCFPPRANYTSQTQQGVVWIAQASDFVTENESPDRHEQIGTG